MSEPSEDSEHLNDLSEDERHVERLLAALPLHESRLNRDQTLFLAGRASVRATTGSGTRGISRLIWPAGVIGSAAAGLLAGILISTSAQRATVRAPTTGTSALVIKEEGSGGVTRLNRVGDATGKAGPSLLDYRTPVPTNDGEQSVLARLDSWRPETGLASDGALPVRSPVPVTYGDLVGPLLKVGDYE